MGSTDILITIGIPLAVGVLALLFGVLLPRMRRSAQRRQGITIAAFVDPGLAVPPRPSRAGTNTPTATAPVPVPASEPEIPRRTIPSSFAPPVRDIPPARETPPVRDTPPAREIATGTATARPRPSPAAVRPVEPPPRPVEPPRLRLEPPEPEPEDIPGHPPRQVPPPLEGTLQFLPGRLEVIEGREMGQEIRFVRHAGPGPTQVTFGRQDGVPYRHIQLHEPTVSRLHARMTLEGGSWRLTNLSRTNPVSVNGASMAPENTSLILKEGDRIEMGEVIFRFRSK